MSRDDVERYRDRLLEAESVDDVEAIVAEFAHLAEHDAGAAGLCEMASEMIGHLHGAARRQQQP